MVKIEYQADICIKDKIMKNDKNTDSYIKASIAAEKLAKAIIRNRDWEQKEVIEFLDENNNLSKLKERLENNDQICSMMKKIQHENQKESCNKLRKRLHKTRIAKRSPIIIAASLSAAAILTLSFILMHPSHNMTPSQQYTIVSNRQIDDISKPTIIVEEGNLKYDIKLDTETKNRYCVTEVNDKITEISYNTLIVPVGFIYTVVLSDSSIVTVNAGGTLKYPVTFSGENREVELTGEAFFEVSKSQKQFIVNSGGSKIIVHGTEFNVKQNSSTNQLEAVLMSGVIGFKGVDSEEVIISPNQKISYDFDSRNAIVESVDADEYTAWRSGFLKFIDKPLSVVLSDVANWYGVKFIFDKNLNDDIVTLNLLKTNSVDEIVEFIDKTTNKKITKKEAGIYVIE